MSVFTIPTAAVLKRLFLCMVLLLFIGCSGFCALLIWPSPARRPREEIRGEILEATPLGCDISIVSAYVKEHYHQFFEDEPFPPFVMKRRIRGEYGSYTDTRSFPFANTVEIVWVFDGKEKLENVDISKFTIGP